MEGKEEEPAPKAFLLANKARVCLCPAHGRRGRLCGRPSEAWRTGTPPLPSAAPASPECIRVQQERRGRSLPNWQLNAWSFFNLLRKYSAREKESKGCGKSRVILNYRSAANTAPPGASAAVRQKAAPGPPGCRIRSPPHGQPWPGTDPTVCSTSE